MYHNVKQINKGQRGVGMGKSMSDGTYWPRPVNKNVLEIGFGQGELVRELAKDNFVCGIDVGQASIEGARNDGFEKVCTLLYMDVCTEKLPWPDNWFDTVYCTEAIEHMSSPQICIESVKRVLVANGDFVVSVPNTNTNFGYGGGNHSWIYPGLGDVLNFLELFTRSWFACIRFRVNGGTNIFVFRNIKNGNKNDHIDEINPYTVTSGNYDFRTVYKKVLEYPEIEDNVKVVYEQMCQKAEQFDKKE